MKPMTTSALARALPALRPSTMDPPADLVARRAGAARSRPAAAPGTSDIQVRETRYSGVPCVVCTPGGARGLVVYFHGGGYRLGSAAQFTPFAIKLAAATRTRVVVVDYRLAPEHPYPAALHDAAAVYEHLLAESPATPVVVGDSAGGGLAAALVAACVNAGVTVPCGLVLMSGWLDLRCTADSYRSRAATDRLFSLDAAQQAAEQYLQGADASAALASPLTADVGAFPSTLLFASADEVLLDDTVAMSAALARARVPVETHLLPGLPHAWPSVLPERPESAAALDIVARFIDRLSAKESHGR